MAVELSIKRSAVPCEKGEDIMEHSRKLKEEQRERFSVVPEIPRNEQVLIYTQGEAWDRNLLQALDFIVAVVSKADRKIASHNVTYASVTYREMSTPLNRFVITVILEPDPSEDDWGGEGPEYFGPHH
jgi:hypothetical protein